MAVLVDTGVLLGAIDADDADHQPAVEVLDRYAGQLLAPTTVIAETTWQLERNLGPAAEATFLEAVIAGELEAIELTRADYQRAVELIRGYADMSIGLVDASIVAIAERMNITTIATLNRRDFAVVRPAHIDAFALIP